MNREEDKTIWLWLNPTHSDFYECYDGDLPNYSTSDADAISLLPVLVERGYMPDLFFCLGQKWNLDVYLDGDIIANGIALNISAAISNAILQLIQREVTP